MTAVTPLNGATLADFMSKDEERRTQSFRLRLLRRDTPEGKRVERDDPRMPKFEPLPRDYEGDHLERVWASPLRFYELKMWFTQADMSLRDEAEVWADEIIGTRVTVEADETMGVTRLTYRVFIKRAAYPYPQLDYQI